MSCTDVQTIQAGNGTKTQFSFDFPYIFKSEIHVYFWNATTKEWDEKLTTDATYPWQVTDANPTIVEFTSTAPPSPTTPTDPGEPTVDNVRIRRITTIDDIRALFNPGSAIRSDDLNNNFEQLRYAIQEGNCEGISEEVYQYLRDYYWDRYDNTLYSADTWRSDDATIATTAALDQRFQDEVNDTLTKAELAAASDVMPDNDDAVPTTGAVKDYVDHVIETDILVDGTGLNKTGSGGQVTIGISAGSVDLDRIKADDIITYAEQPTVATSDNNIFTASAAERQFDTIVQTTTPTGTDWEIGKTWLQNDSNKTLSVWNGTTWLGVASGGTFTTQPTVIYVDSVNGDDANDGHRIITPKATIKAAVGDANDGDIVIVAPGVYQETLPIDITVNNLSIVGNAQRSCFIHPTVATEENIMFRCNSGTYIDGFTFTGLKASGTRGNHAIDDDATYGLPENQGWVASFYPGCTILKSPYINNCTSYMDSAVDNADFDPNNPAGTGGDTTSAMTGGGILVDGSVPDTASPLRSFVVNEFTQVNLDGPGLLVCNNGYAQAVSFFALFCHYHAKALTGGQINMEVGTTDFGRYGLIADGKSGSAIFTATADGAASTSDTSFLINAPAAAADWFGTAERPANTMLVEVGGNIYPILSSTANGSGWSVAISNPNPSNRADNQGLVNGHSSGATVNFYLRSQISAAAHTFEYAGSGVNYSALPQNGGVANETNQVVQTGAAAIAGGQTEGAVFYSSTDENGKFKVGDTFQVDQKTGFVTIDPQSYSPNIVQDLTPQLGGDLDVQTHDIITSITNGDITITPNGTGNVVLDGLRYPEADGTTGQFLQTDGAGNLTFQDAITEVLEDTTPQLGGDLDVQTHAINTSTTDGDIDLDANGSGLIQVTEFNLSQVPIVTQHDIGTAANEVPLNGYLGGMAFQDPASVSLDSINGDVYFDSSGRLLVGLTTGANRNLLQVQGDVDNGANGVGGISLRRGVALGSIGNGSQLGQLDFCMSDGGVAARIICDAEGSAGTGDYPGRLQFETTADGASSPTERMRIDSAGGLRIFSTGSSTRISSSASAGTAEWLLLGSHSATAINTGSNSFIVYTNGNVENTNNSYGAISDIKLKENIVDAGSQWDDLKAIQVRKYNFKEETGQQTHTQLGVVAQEVELVSPGLVTESPDRDEEGNDLGTTTKSVNYSVLYMKAVKALQEAMERIETLETKVAALEGGTN